MSISHVQHVDMNAVPGGTTQTLNITPNAIGNIIVVAVWENNTGGSQFAVSSISGGGVTTWNHIISNPGGSTLGRVELWWGVVTATGAQTITVTYAGTPSPRCGIDADEFSSSVAGTWSVVGSGTGTGAATANVPLGTVTSTTGTQFGYAYGWCGQTGQASAGGGTAGDAYTYTVDGISNVYAFAVNLTATTVETPVGLQAPSGASQGAHAVFLSTPSGGGGVTPERSLLGVGT